MSSVVTGARHVGQAEARLHLADDALRGYVSRVLVVAVGGGSPPAPPSGPGASLPLLHPDHVDVPMLKFTRFSMDPAGGKRGRWRAWPQLGYDVENPSGRERAAADVGSQPKITNWLEVHREET